MLKILRNKKEMMEVVGHWPTAEITCNYNRGENTLIATCKGQTVKYVNNDILSVCWWAMNCNGANKFDYNKVWDKVNKNR